MNCYPDAFGTVYVTGPYLDGVLIVSHYLTQMATVCGKEQVTSQLETLNISIS